VTVYANLRKIIPFTAVLLILGGPSFAQGLEKRIDARTVTVTERVKPELDPLGVNAGAFKILPSIDIVEIYNDNIFATSNNEKSDLITGIVPALKFKSNWNRHHIGLSGEADILRYGSNSSENQENYLLSFDGRVDMTDDTNGSVKVGYERDSEARGSVDDAAGQTPTEFDVVSFDAGLTTKWNRVSVGLDGKFLRRDYDDVSTTATAVNNDDRDRDEFSLGVRSAYEIQSEYEAYMQLIATQVDYDSSVDDNGVNRDNQGYEIRLGSRVDITGLIFADLFVGYLHRNYDGASLRDVDTLVGGADVTWNISSLTTLKGGVGREISETTLATASGNLTTSYRFSIDHELLRNLILSARIGILNDDFEGSNREDDYLKAGLRAHYTFNRYLSTVLDYDHSNRDSSTPGADNEINKIMIRIKAQL
jgi:hypothetical protein